MYEYVNIVIGFTDSRLSSTYTEPSILRTLVKKFKFVVDRAVNNTLDEQHATKHLSPFDKLRKTRFPNNAHVRRQFKAAETMELVMEFIKNSTTGTNEKSSKNVHVFIMKAKNKYILVFLLGK